MVRRKSIKKHLGELAAVTKLGMAEDDFTNFHLHAAHSEAQSDLYLQNLILTTGNAFFVSPKGRQ